MTIGTRRPPGLLPRRRAELLAAASLVAIGGFVAGSALGGGRPFTSGAPGPALPRGHHAHRAVAGATLIPPDIAYPLLIATVVTGGAAVVAVVSGRSDPPWVPLPNPRP